MTREQEKWVGRLVACAIAGVIFAVDCMADFNVSVSTLYIASLVVISARSDEREILRVAVFCILLSCISWYIVHRAEPDIASALRLAFATIAIAITSGLLISRKHLASARRQLEESQDELLNFTDSVPQILWRFSADGTDFLNRRYTEITGRDREESLRAQNWLELFHPDDREPFTADMQRALARGEDIRGTYRMLQADGSYRWMSSAGRLVRSNEEDPLIWYGGTSDVHDEVLARHELERLKSELEESRADVELFANSVPYILWRGTAEGAVTFFNQRWSDVTGADRHEVIEEAAYLELVHPDDREGLLSIIRQAVATNSASETQVRVRQRDGSYRWMHLYDRPVASPVTGEIERFGGAADIQLVMDMRAELQELNDTLEQRVSERTSELLRTEARYAGLFEVSNMTFAEMDFSATEPHLDRIKEQGVTDLASYLGEHPDEFRHLLSLVRTTRVNQALARLMGYESVAELISNPPAQNASDGPAVLLRQLEMYYYDIDHIEGRTVLTGKDGIEIPVFFMATRLAEGLHLSSHINLSEQERITEMREAAKEELARANRIATVGAFSASIAHELNQPIASMVMDTQTGLRSLQREDPDLSGIERILERLTRTAQRVSSIVQHTRSAIMAGQRVSVPLDVCDIAEETRELLERDLRRASISLRLLYPKDLPLAFGDPVQLQQVLVNLINNASEAMRDWEGRRVISVSLASGEDQVEIVVADTGPGIAEENLEKLFEPFFTTKVAGIGMGLQISRSAIEGMGGELTVRNLVNGGAAFSFTLPTARYAEQG